MLSCSFCRVRGHRTLKVTAVLSWPGHREGLLCRASGAALTPGAAVLVSHVCTPVLTPLTGATAM